MSFTRDWLVAVASVVFVLVTTSPLTAAEPSAPTVALVVPAAPDPVVAEVLVRVEGELRAAGFDVIVVRQASDETPEKSLEHAATDLSPMALVGVFEASRTGLDLWVLDRSKQRTIRRAVRNADLGSRNSEVLAVRTAEQLSASLQELDIAASPPPEQPPKAAPPARAPKDAPTPRSPAIHAGQRFVSLELGPALVFSLEGIAPALLPLLRVGVNPTSSFAIRLAGAALGSRPQISSPLGTARFAQSLVLADVTYAWRSDSPFRPYAALGAGAYHAKVVGSSAVELPSVESATWAATFELGAGCRYRLSPRFEVGAEFDALLTYPYVVVRFADDERAKTGRPALLGSAVLSISL